MITASSDPSTSKGWRYRAWSEVTTFIQALIEVIPATLWVHQLGAVACDYWTTLIILSSTMLVCYGFMKYFHYHQVNYPIRLTAIFSWLALSIIYMYHTVYDFNGNFLKFIFESLLNSGSASVMVPLVAFMVLTWRMMTLANRLPEASTIRKSIQHQFVFIFLFGIAYPRGAVEYGLTMFYIVMLLAVSGSLSHQVARLDELHGGRVPFIDRKWVLWLMLISVIVLLTGITAGWLIEGRVSIWIGQAVVYIVLGVITLVGILLLPLLILIYLATNWLADFYVTQTGSEPVDLLGTDAFDRLFQGEEPRDILGPIVQSLQPYFWAGIIVILAIVIAWMIRRQVTLRAMKIEADGSSLSSLHSRKSGPTLGRRLRDRLRPQAYFQAIRLRWIYGRLCLLGEKLGCPRSPAATPQEYLPSLKAIFPNQNRCLDQITSAYQATRYGAVPEDAETIALVEKCWEEIQKDGKAKLQKKKKTKSA